MTRVIHLAFSHSHSPLSAPQLSKVPMDLELYTFQAVLIVLEYISAVPANGTKGGSSLTQQLSVEREEFCCSGSSFCIYPINFTQSALSALLDWSTLYNSCSSLVGGGSSSLEHWSRMGQGKAELHFQLEAIEHHDTNMAQGSHFCQKIERWRGI
ncbi:hypothetical protein EK904_012814 [Melospiza melodia maxima]|nr:hypothetical protein EK904_012814 [Melospiza melodia maxima]